MGQIKIIENIESAMTFWIFSSPASDH